MKAKRFVALAAAISVAVGLFSFGYWRGERHEKLASIRFNLASSLHLYSAAKKDPHDKLESDLAFLVYSFTQEYKKHVSENAVPVDFQPEFIEAQRISKQVETNLVVIKP